MDALKSASAMLAELRTSSLTPVSQGSIVNGIEDRFG